MRDLLTLDSNHTFGELFIKMEAKDDEVLLHQILSQLAQGKKNLAYGHFWGTDGRSLDREGEVVRSRRGF